MLLTRQNDWVSPFHDLHEQFNRMLSRQALGEGSEGRLGVYPVDIHEDEKHVYVDAEMPGFTKDQIHLSLEDGVLTLSAERTDEEMTEKKHLNERRFTKVRRAFVVPASIDPQRVDATLDHGVLKVTLHKRDEVTPKRIEIK